MSFRPINGIQVLSLLTVLFLAVYVPWQFLRVQHAHMDTNNSIRTVLCYFEIRTLQNPQLTVRQRRQAITLYNDVLARISEPSC